MNRPLVSAMMITGSSRRRKMAQIAVNCFLEQTYENKELVIVNHGTTMSIDDSRVREVSVVDSGPVGLLRNLAMENAKGKILIFWDDDDWSAPERMEVQIGHLKPDHACLLQRQLRLDLRTQRCIAVCWGCGIPGTMAFSKDDKLFSAMWRGSDAKFLESFGPKKIAIENNASLFVRNFHGWNLWDERHIMWPEGARMLTVDERAFVNRVIIPLYANALSD
jgi:glycosyltransferase involved in cell wall biosynthesis